MATIKSDQQVQLTKGMRIRFLEDWPAYEVENIGNTKPLLTLHRAWPMPDHVHSKDLPPTFTMRSQYTVGREMDSDLKIHSKDEMISRNHGVFHFSPQNQHWYYTHYGANPGAITHSKQAVEIIDRAQVEPTSYHRRPQVEYEDTVTNELRGNAEPVNIVNGMTFQFHPALPIYEAKITTKDNQPFLTLERQDETSQDKRYPARIEVTKNQTIALGRITGENAVVLPHPNISRDHASIAWDEAEESFLYEPAPGSLPPIIRMPKLLTSLQNEYAKMTFAKTQAEQQLPEINTLIDELQTHKGLAERAQQLELDTVATPWFERDKGAHTEDSQKGYEMWLRAYEMLFREKLAETSSQALLHMANAIGQMSEDRRNLRNIEPYPQPALSLPPDLTQLKDGSDRDKQIQSYVDRKALQLQEKGELYLVSGFNRHHTVTRIRKDASGYLVSNYNAGAGTTLAPDGEHVLGMYERRLKNTSDVREFIWLTTERKFWPRQDDIGKALKSAINNKLEPKILRSHEVVRQHKGNCTTRSTREALRDALDFRTFTELHSHVSDPNMATVDDLLSALEVKRAALERSLGIKIQRWSSPKMPPSRPADNNARHILLDGAGHADDLQATRILSTGGQIIL